MLEPIKTSDWNPALAAHLLRRAGFGATPQTIQRFADMSPKEAVNRIVHYETGVDELKPPAWIDEPDADHIFDLASLEALPENERKKAMREHRQLQSSRLLGLQRWWLNRMRKTPNPLEEKLTLFWHGHFATSFEKVREVYALYLQNQTFRENASGNFKDLVTAVAQDPAMLYYLDNAISTKKAPNENFARELMELFTLGEGNYSEEDVKASARAFTGWSVERRRIRFLNRPFTHDSERKTFMTFTGNLDGHDVINEILEHPVCPQFISEKIWRFFAYEDMPAGMGEQLGEVFYDADFELKPLLETIFMSREFYSWEAAHAQIKSPVQWLVGSAIALEGELPAAEDCMMIMRTLGQELFMPPNVKGWDGGPSWITAASLMQRYNLAGYLVKGEQAMTGKPMNKEMIEEDDEAYNVRTPMPSIANLDRLLPKSERDTLDGALKDLEWRLFQNKLNKQEEFAMKFYMTTLIMPSRWSDEELQNILHVMMSTPYYQVC